MAGYRFQLVVTKYCYLDFFLPFTMSTLGGPISLNIVAVFFFPRTPKSNARLLPAHFAFNTGPQSHVINIATNWSWTLFYQWLSFRGGYNHNPVTTSPILLLLHLQASGIMMILPSKIMVLILLFSMVVYSAPVTVPRGSTGSCSPWAVMNASPYELQSNLWGASGASGSQCTVSDI